MKNLVGYTRNNVFTTYMIAPHSSPAGVSSVEASAETKKVTVTADSSLTSDQLLEQLNKTGKVCSYLGVKQ